MRKIASLKILEKFDNLTLNELNSTASFLKRIDRKFLLTFSKFKKILKALKNDFRILEIDGKRVFDYDNVYMDTKDLLFYNQHQSGENPRTKVRTRLYKDSDLAFFEYKHKQDGVTQKFRYSFPIQEHGLMTKGKKRFFEGVWQSLHNGEKAPEIVPTIRTSYNRITLVSRNGEERLTIDFNVRIQDLNSKNGKTISLDNLVIVESKTLKKDSIAVSIMNENGLKRAKACSKYSLGVVYSGLVEKYDYFKETMKKIKEIRMDTLKNRNRDKRNIFELKNNNNQFVKQKLKLVLKNA